MFCVEANMFYVKRPDPQATFLLCDSIALCV